MPRTASLVAIASAAITSACVCLPWYAENMGDEPARPVSGFGLGFHGTLAVSLAATAVLAAVASALRANSVREGALGAACLYRATIAAAALLTLLDLVRRAFDDWVDEVNGFCTGSLGVGIYLTLLASVVGMAAASLRVWELRQADLKAASA